jgi:fused signal recognition particle receptor
MIKEQALVAQTDAMAMLAQAGDSSMYVVIVLFIVIAAVVIGMVLASRRGDAGGDAPEAPKVKDPKDDIESPNVDILDTRQDELSPEIQAILAKPRSEWTLKETKMVKMAKVSDKEIARRQTAIEATKASEEKHSKIESKDTTNPEESEEPQDAGDEEDAPEEAAAKVDAEPPSEPELSEVSSPEEDADDTSGSDAFDDDSWGFDDSEFEDDEDEDEGGSDDEPEASEPEEDAPAAKDPEPEPAPVAAAADEPKPKAMSDGLEKTRGRFGKTLRNLFSNKEEVDDDLKDDIEEFLYTSDIGSAATRRVMKEFESQIADGKEKDPQAVWDAVRATVRDMLKEIEEPMVVEAKEDGPMVILVVGVNGAGKTTSIGKMASKYKHEGKSVMLVAGDTFRAAAVEQLEVWAKRVAIPIHKGESEADPASVVFDGIKRARDEGVDVVLCDTSGRLHTNANLMAELQKIHRVSGKAMDGAPHETLLVLDANTGQNALQQAKEYGQALGLTGLVLTKLDGTARGGVILGIGEEVHTPVRYIGIGEGVEDLRPFDADEFVDALFL